MAHKNPFEVLGLTPSAMRGLRDEQVKVLLKHVMRGLQAVHHPDVGGRDEKMAEINKAISDLKDPKVFSSLRKEYLKSTPSRKRMESLEIELAHTNELLFGQVSVLWDYFMCLFGSEDSPNIFNLKDVYVSDTIHSHNRAIHSKIDPDGRILRGEVYILNVENAIPKRRYVERKGRNKPVEIYKEVAYPTKRLIGSISDNVVTALGGLPGLLLLLQGQITSNDGVLRMQGCGGKKRNMKWFENYVAVEHFKVIMPHLSPFVSSYSHLFAVNDVESEKPYITLEGRVIKGL